MEYIFNDGTQDFDVWMNSWSDTIKIDNKYIRSLRTDDSGKFFTWNKKKFYVDDYKKISINSIKDKINRKEWFTDSEFCQAVLSEGVDNIKFNVPMNIVDFSLFGLTLVDSTKTINKICHIEESYNRFVHDTYKLKLVVDDYDGSTVKTHDYYITDFVSLLRDGYISIA